MRHEDDEFDLLLSWALREFVSDEDPPPRVWEAIEAKLALRVSPEEGRPLVWRRKAGAWLRGALYSAQAVLLFLLFRLEEAPVWAEEQPGSASVAISVSAAPWPLYSFNSQMVIIGLQRRGGMSI